MGCISSSEKGSPDTFTPKSPARVPEDARAGRCVWCGLVVHRCWPSGIYLRRSNRFGFTGATFFCPLFNGSQGITFPPSTLYKVPESMGAASPSKVWPSWIRVRPKAWRIMCVQSWLRRSAMRAERVFHARRTTAGTWPLPVHPRRSIQSATSSANRVGSG